MYTTTSWPERAALGLSKPVYKALIEHITTPFDTLAQAQSFWLASSSECVHLHPAKQVTLTKQQLLCLSEPDFIETLDGYLFFCRITNDYGGGLFVLLPLPKGGMHDNHD